MNQLYSFDRYRSSHILMGLLAIMLVAGLAAPYGVAMASEDPATDTDGAVSTQEAKSSEQQKAFGKLEIPIARDPDLAMVPVAVNARSRDLLAQVSTVEKVADEAEEALDDGRIQEARRLLDGLASEYVVSTSLMPLATFPEAIRKAVLLIDAGKVDESSSRWRGATTTRMRPSPYSRKSRKLRPRRTEATNENSFDRIKKLLSDLT